MVNGNACKCHSLFLSPTYKENSTKKYYENQNQTFACLKKEENDHKIIKK